LDPPGFRVLEVMTQPIDMLNKTLAIDALRGDFAASGRVRVPEILVSDFAAQAANLLQTGIPWQVAFRRGGEAVSMTETEFAALGPDQQQQLLGAILQQASTDFQYLYSYYKLADAYQDFKDDSLFVFRLIEFMASEHFLGFAQQVSGIEDIKGINIQATRYVGGQFLNRHDDAEDPKRLVAFVLGLTREWSPGWGGVLQITDENGDIVESYVPRFNSMVMFKVPLMHCVSYVAPFAQVPRYSLTGWFTT